MIFKNVGQLLKKNTKPNSWWLKLAVALVLSNMFFFLLFSNKEKAQIQEVVETIPADMIEAQLRADLLTPFQKGKKVLLLTRIGQRYVEGVLQGAMDSEGRYTILIKAHEANVLFGHEGWEILPFFPYKNFPRVTKGSEHEIRY